MEEHAVVDQTAGPSMEDDDQLARSPHLPESQDLPAVVVSWEICLDRVVLVMVTCSPVVGERSDDQTAGRTASTHVGST
ncbi:hypothetical protein DMB42_44760 [Nonomuraea sp. WAC 01424]|nr:hypothetical protein DMB42_44760 [Nonomuraea sp. WAC 01424]